MDATTSNRRGLWFVLGAGLLAGVALGLVALAGLPGALPQGIPGPGPAGGVEAAPVVGAPAPDFTLERLDGQKIALSDHRGSPLLINFWATWCGPCRIEMPAIQSRYESYAASHGLKVLAVDFDEPRPDVAAFAESLGLTFDVLLDPGGQIQQLYRVRGYPTSLFVDREGIIQVLHIGGMTEGQLDGYLEQIGVP